MKNYMGLEPYKEQHPMINRILTGVIMGKQTKEHIEARISKLRGFLRGPSPFRKTTEKIIEEISTRHGDRYLLDRVKYINSSTKIEIGCKIHGYFFKFPNDIKGKGGCPRCGNSFIKTTDEFVLEVSTIFPDYDFSKVVYKNAHTKVEVSCPTHGIFSIKPNTLLSGSGCGACGPQRALTSRIKNGQCRHPDDISEHEKYKSAVWKETDKTFKKYFVGENRNATQHLDHIVSITDGWSNNVPPEIIGSKVNLRLLNGILNRKKSNKSDMTIEELYTLYNQIKDIK